MEATQRSMRTKIYIILWQKLLMSKEYSMNQRTLRQNANVYVCGKETDHFYVIWLRVTWFQFFSSHTERVKESLSSDSFSTLKKIISSNLSLFCTAQTYTHLFLCHKYRPSGYWKHYQTKEENMTSEQKAKTAQERETQLWFIVRPPQNRN